MKQTTATPKSVWIHETFVSINGEVCQSHQGSLTWFIRCSGCNLKCEWCDTPRSHNLLTGADTPISLLAEMARDHGLHNITITGGEPLTQRDGVIDLIIQLIRDGFYVTVETNGTIKVPSMTKFFQPRSHLRKNLSWVIDIKLPSSGYYDHHFENNFPRDLASHDWIKLVIASGEDYEIAKDLYFNILSTTDANIAFSPVTEAISAKELVRRVIDDKLKRVVVNLQLHKYIHVR